MERLSSVRAGRARLRWLDSRVREGYKSWLCQPLDLGIDLLHAAHLRAASVGLRQAVTYASYQPGAGAPSLVARYAVDASRRCIRHAP